MHTAHRLKGVDPESVWSPHRNLDHRRVNPTRHTEPRDRRRGGHSTRGTRPPTRRTARERAGSRPARVLTPRLSRLRLLSVPALSLAVASPAGAPPPNQTGRPQSMSGKPPGRNLCKHGTALLPRWPHRGSRRPRTAGTRRPASLSTRRTAQTVGWSGP